MSYRSDAAAQNMQAFLGGNTGGTAANSYDATPTPAPTPAQDFGSYPDNTPNPYTTDDSGTSGQDALLSSAAEEPKQPETTAAPQTDNEAARTAAATESNANLYNAIGNTAPPSDDYLSNSGITRSQWDQMTSVLNSSNAQQFIDTMNSSPEGKAILAAYNSYYATPQQATPATVTPEPQATPQAPSQNPILPSAGGNYQADEIYDPSKTYGRQPDGSYVYSSSAAQLQRDLNRVMDAGLKVDGYFGEKTQEALNAYLAQNGKQSTTASTPATAETPISENGSMSAALAASSAEAPKQEQQSNVDQAVQNTSSNSSKQAHDDAWYAEQYEKITGNAPRTDILSPERIRDFVDNEMANRPVNPEDEGYDAMLQQQALYEQAQEQQRINEMNARRDEAFTPQFINDLRNGKSVEQILNEGDLSYNRWIQDNWDDLAYTYNLGDQSPFESQPTEQREPINYAAMLDELSQMDRNDWYQRPESQPADAEREPINYNAMADELAQFEYNDAFIRQQDMNDAYSPRQTFNDNYRAELERLQQPQGEVYGSQRNGSVPERYTAPRQPLEYSDAFIRQEEMKDAYSPYADYSGGMASDDIQSSSGTASSDEQAMREAYEAAMQSAGRARDIFSRLPTEAEQIQQTREQWIQNQRNALEQQVGPYMRQFQQEYASYRQQFPNYPDSAIMDMILMNEENNNGRSSYYRWLSNQL